MFIVIESGSFCFVTWSITEKREIRNFYYPSVFELAGRQRMTVKRGIGIWVNPFRPKQQIQVRMETNRCLHSVTGWIKNGIVGHIVVLTNLLTGEEEDRS